MDIEEYYKSFDFIRWKSKVLCEFSPIHVAFTNAFDKREPEKKEQVLRELTYLLGENLFEEFKTGIERDTSGQLEDLKFFLLQGREMKGTVDAFVNGGELPPLPKRLTFADLTDVMSKIST